MRWLAVLLAGCITEHVGVTPRELLHHVPELRDQGHAEVALQDGGTYELSADRTFEVTIGGHHTRLAVRDMVAGCPDVPPFAGQPASPRCLLANTTIDHFELDTRHHFDWEVPEGLVGGIVVLLAITGIASFICYESADGC